jgi:hypothetical protein
MSGEHAKKEVSTGEKPESSGRSMKTKLHQRRSRYLAISTRRKKKNLSAPSSRTRRATRRKRR